MVIGVWGRRSLAPWTAPLLVAALAFGVWSRNGWQYEWLWGLRAVVLLMPLAAPVLAAAVAFDIARHWGPVVTTLGPSTRRWRHATLALVAAHVLWAFACVCLVWVAVGVRLVMNRATWQPDVWLPFEVLAALGAAAAVGLLIGMRVRSLAAPPLAAVLVLATEALAGPYGFISLFAPMTVVDSVVGLERNPWAAAWAIAMNVAVLVWCSSLALRGPGRTPGWLVAVGASTAALVVVVAGHAQQAPVDFRSASQPQVCLTSGSTQVCGPENFRTFLRDLADSLDTGLATLAPSGLPLPHHFVLGRAGVHMLPQTQAAIAFVSPAQLTPPRRTATVARVLSQPRMCRQLIDPNADTTALLERQEQVRVWIERALRGRPTTAPGFVRAAYGELITCRLSP